jgi:hypothetical protein
MLWKAMFIGTVCVILAGCGKHQGIETSTISRKPEAVFQNAALTDVRNRLVEYCTNSQMNVLSASDHMVVCEDKDNVGDALTMGFIYGSAHAGDTRTSYRFTLVQQQANVRVISNEVVESHGAFGARRTMEMNSGDRFAHAQATLTMWAVGAPFCKAQRDLDWHKACDRIHPGWRA